MDTKSATLILPWEKILGVQAVLSVSQWWSTAPLMWPFFHGCVKNCVMLRRGPQRPSTNNSAGAKKKKKKRATQAGWAGHLSPFLLSLSSTHTQWAVHVRKYVRPKNSTRMNFNVYGSPGPPYEHMFRLQIWPHCLIHKKSIWKWCFFASCKKHGN